METLTLEGSDARKPRSSHGEPRGHQIFGMGNPKKPISTGTCKSCNANGGLWHGEPGSVHCLRPMNSRRHGMRGDQSKGTRSCWQPVTQPLPLEVVMELVRRY
jgi:hypothetical protein